MTKAEQTTIHAKPCAACTIRLGRLSPTAPVMLKHEHWIKSWLSSTRRAKRARSGKGS